MRKLKLLLLSALPMLLLHTRDLIAQQTFPVNGISEPRTGCYAFTNATIIKDGQSTITSGTLIIREGKIIGVGTGLPIPKDAITINCSGKYIYPSLVDIYSDYGMPAPRQPGPNDFFSPQFTTNVKGPYGWNQAIHSETDAIELFNVNNDKAKALLDNGFGTVLTHNKDGIARGTGAVVMLGSDRENLEVVKERASAHYSFNKGSSSQSYPTSMMGSVALLRQTYLDAQWYKSLLAGQASLPPGYPKEGLNMSLQAWNDAQSLPQIFEANDKWGDLRADRIGDEFGIQYIIKGGNNEYQRMKEIAGTKASFILSLNFPLSVDVDDPNDARFVSLNDMKNWELAPGNAASFEKANIPFCISSTDLKDSKQFWANLRKAMDYGLSEKKAFEALTKTPCQLLGIYDKVGSLENGKMANFLITNGELFKEKTIIIENWVHGQKHEVKEEAWNDIRGKYNLVINGPAGTENYSLDVKNSSEADLIAQDTAKAKINYNGKLVTISFSPPFKKTGKDSTRETRASIRLSGVANAGNWEGVGADTLGRRLTWNANFEKTLDNKPDSNKRKAPDLISKVTYPFGGYGNEEVPRQEDILIKNSTVWTNESDGRLETTDVLIRAGKIVQIGKNLQAGTARVIDGSGKFLSPGIVDEHSHIAAFSINEGAQSVTSEVRIGDNLDPDDVDIYRQLSGGVTTSHILHGSANTIGGQTQLIKLRWGVNDEELKFKGADPFIKFALGENVKRTPSQSNTRYPDTRMGVEEVQVDAFQRAADYQKQWKEAEEHNKKKGATPSVVRRNLELDALVEILNRKRFITCHSYVQSEILELMKVADRFGFKVNTFTHILEGYKVADKMKAHGANASTFSDWWAYKLEVQDAIAYNPTIMQRVGLNVCINSDDPEMARRLNQEAAKSVKYGGMSEEDAFKMVTINPAKALHVDDRIGSIKVGKDADVVLWSDNPLSIYAQALYTIVDGTVYFDRSKDLEKRKLIHEQRTKLIEKMMAENKANPGGMAPARASQHVVLHCEDYERKKGLLETDHYEQE